MKRLYDVIVVGGGHAGYEAALSSARIGAKTLLITLQEDMIGRLPCNPSIGGIAKSHIVSEIDALGGELGRNADYTGIQYRMLNTRKGAAVQSNRLQCDKDLFPVRIQAVIRRQENLDVLEDLVTEIRTKNGQLKGITGRSSGPIDGKTVVIATGTFLRGRVMIGMTTLNEGRMGEESAEELSDSFSKLGFELGRLKTGTPPRLHKDSLNYNKMQIQPGDTPPPFYSRQARREWEVFHMEQAGISPADLNRLFHVEQADLHPWMPGSDQIPCYLTHTNETTHQIISDNLEKSSMYGGMVEGTGVRYCPSIEDKIVKFAGRDSHHVFVEPEGRKSIRIYPNGTSNSLPEEVQREMIHSIEGLEKAEFIRPGYAIEYDYANPQQLFHTLETKKVENLFFAGQLNGTTGYEEAAGQGFIAGVNAAGKALGLPPFTLGRDEGYIGVLIDDLVTKGTDEPYRMFTSRSEHRLTLRQDNVYYRLLQHAKTLNIVPAETLHRIEQENEKITAEIKRMSTQFHDGSSMVQWLRRPECSYADLPHRDDTLSPAVIKQVEIEVKYEGYIKRERERIESARKMETQQLPQEVDYFSITGLRHESAEKMNKIRPENIGQASRISGVNPSDITILSMWIKKRTSK